MGDNIVIFIILGVVLVGVVGYIAWQMEKKRREALRRWAAANGYSFDPSRRRDPDLGFSIFGKGHSRWLRYHMARWLDEATPGLERAGIELFEYHYAVTTHSGKSSSTRHYHHTCAVVEAGVNLGEMTIRKEHFGDKIVQAVGFDDIDFEDHEFSKTYMVKARDRKRAYGLIDRRMMEFLKSDTRWRLETLGEVLFVYRSGRIKAERAERLAGFCRGFLATIPRTLVNEERERRGLPPLVDAGSAARHHREEEA